MSERGKQNQKYRQCRYCLWGRGAAWCRSFLQRSQGWLGKLLNETGYFPAKPRITYVFHFCRWRKMGLGWKRKERVSSRPTAGALGGSCWRPRKTLRHPDTPERKKQPFTTGQKIPKKLCPNNTGNYHYPLLSTILHQTKMPKRIKWLYCAFPPTMRPKSLFFKKTAA